MGGREERRTARRNYSIRYLALPSRAHPSKCTFSVSMVTRAVLHRLANKARASPSLTTEPETAPSRAS